jgi:hypothetical protein
MYLVAAIVAERDARNREKTDAAPPVLPLEIAGLSTIEFMELLFEHEERLRHSFPGNVVNEVISNEFEQLVRLISRDSNLKAALTKGSEDSDFGKAWRPLGNRFPYMLHFAASLASVMPGKRLWRLIFRPSTTRRMIIVLHSQASLWKAYCTRGSLRSHDKPSTRWHSKKGINTSLSCLLPLPLLVISCY